MTPPFSLPGYDVEALLATGGTGEVWRGREQATGRPVAVQLLRDGADPQALLRQAQALTRLDTPYLVRLHHAVADGEQTVLVLDLAGGGSLTALLRRRGTLTPGEVVTVAVPVAQALAAAHAAGLVHGDVSPSNVLLTDDGMPLLRGLGTTDAGRPDPEPDSAEYRDPAVAAGGPVTDATDVWALAALCHHLLAGSPPDERAEGARDDVLGSSRTRRRVPLGRLAPEAPQALVDAVEAALVTDPAIRPDAAGFAASLRQAHPAEPVRFDAAVPTAAVPTAVVPDARVTGAGPRHAVVASRATPGAPQRRVPRWLVPAALAAVLLLSAASLGWWWGGAGDVPTAPVPLAAPASAAPAPAPSESVDVTDWAAVLDALDAARAEAFAAADPARLEAAYAPGAPGLLADRALVEQLSQQGHTAAGVRHQVREVEQLELSEDRARLRVLDVLPGYEVRDAGGDVVRSAPPRGETAYLVELARVDDGWRLVQVEPA